MLYYSESALFKRHVCRPLRKLPPDVEASCFWGHPADVQRPDNPSTVTVLFLVLQWALADGNVACGAGIVPIRLQA